MSLHTHPLAVASEITTSVASCSWPCWLMIDCKPLTTLSVGRSGKLLLAFAFLVRYPAGPMTIFFCLMTLDRQLLTILGCVRPRKLLLALITTVILGLGPHGTHDPYFSVITPSYYCASGFRNCCWSSPTQSLWFQTLWDP
jgi:hypothetical protein